MSYKKLQPFFDLLCEYQRVERVVRVPGQDRWENNVEHSYILSMLAWYIVTRDKLNLDLSRVLRYALVHDLVEVYAGDTFIYDAEARKTKHDREAKAQQQLKASFPEFVDLHESITAYEGLQDREARFVKALDKLHPMLAIYTDGGRTWREQNVELRELIRLKQEHIDRSPEIKPYFDSFVAHLRTRPELFKT